MLHDFDKRSKEMHDSFNKDMKGIKKFALVAIVLNFVLGLGFIAGICWIVKYFFFN